MLPHDVRWPFVNSDRLRSRVGVGGGGGEQRGGETGGKWCASIKRGFDDENMYI